MPKEVRRTIEGIYHNYRGDFIDFCFWGMRKALIDAIRIRFISDEKEKMLYDKNGDSYRLPKWIELAKQERYISSITARDLNSQVKVFGDVASHDDRSIRKIKRAKILRSQLVEIVFESFFEHHFKGVSGKFNKNARVLLSTEDKILPFLSPYFSTSYLPTLPLSDGDTQTDRSRKTDKQKIKIEKNLTYPEGEL